MSLKLGELCAGYGGLGMAVEEVFNAETAWFSEFDAAPSKILSRHWPDVPNYGDMTKIDWAAIEPVDIISGGTPCQDLSAAGRRAGMTEGTRSNLWVQMREAIAIQRPRYVVWENVRGAYSATAASDLEQCPGCLGDTGNGGPVLRALGRVMHGDGGLDLRTLISLLSNPEGLGWRQRGPEPARVQRRPHAPIGRREDLPDAISGGRAGRTREAWWKAQQRTSPERSSEGIAWLEYEAWVRSWERLTRPAPRPTEPTGRNGNHRLSPYFTEWMMGLPEGWVTDPTIGLTRNEQIKACGNGVVPQQAMAALRDMLAAFQQLEVAA